MYHARVLRSVLAIIFTVSIFACSKTSDEEQIRLIIEKLSAAVEANKPAVIADYLHEDFRANGDMDVQQIKQLLTLHALQHQSLAVTILSVQIRIDPVYQDRAESILSVVTTASTGSVLPQDGSVRVVTLQWRKDDNWKVLTADWQE